MSVSVEVLCKETNKTVWTETHKSDVEADRAVEQLMLNHFHPDHFNFRKGGELNGTSSSLSH